MAGFTSDVMDFILHTEKEQQSWLIQELHRYCQDPPSETTPVKALQFRLAAFQVEGRLGWQRAHASEAGTRLSKPAFVSTRHVTAFGKMGS
jgi:hypothetical protein